MNQKAAAELSVEEDLEQHNIHTYMSRFCLACSMSLLISRSM